MDYSKQNDLIKFKLENGDQVMSPAFLNNLLPQKGEEVFALGYPNGFNIQGESTVTTGIISGIREENSVKIIQTSTPFTHGSSGGGLFDVSGKLVGITSGTFAQEVKDRHANLNKVIPVALVNKLTRNLNLALTTFYENIKNDENFIRGMVAYDNFDFETTADFFLAHIRDYPEDATAWFRLGNSHNQSGQSGSNGRGSINKEMLTSALECFDMSISLDNNYYYAWGQAALVYSIVGDITSAKSFAYKAYQIEPNISFTNYVVGKVANVAEDYNLAIEFLSVAIQKADDYEKVNNMNQWYLERAIAYSLLKNDDYSAEQDYLKCLKLNPDNYDAIFNYGVFLINRKRKREACERFTYLYEILPNYRFGNQSLEEIVRYCK